MKLKYRYYQLSFKNKKMIVVTPTNKNLKIGQVELIALLYSKYLVYLSLSRSNVTAVIDNLILNLNSTINRSICKTILSGARQPKLLSKYLYIFMIYLYCN